MKIISKILSQPEITSRPPVFVDIGASGAIHNEWKSIAPYAICIAFDADDREFAFAEKKGSGYKKLFVFNSAVSDTDNTGTDFYLTESPYCSSLLQPDNEKLTPWFFADKFLVSKKVSVKNISLRSALEKAGVDYVDWFKSDSQGTDLRLFQNLGDDIINEVLIAEFEPGLIDSYKGEDKLYKVLECMQGKDFFLSSITVKGSRRISPGNANKIFPSSFLSKLAVFSLPVSPGWGEMEFLKAFNGTASRRSLMLGFAFAMLRKQHGHALHIAQTALQQFNEPLFQEMEQAARCAIRRGIFSLRFLPVIREKLSKLVSGV